MVEMGMNRVFWGFFAAVLLLAASAEAAVQVLGSASAKDEDNDTSLNLGFTAPAGTQLLVLGVSNRDNRAVSSATIDGVAFHMIVDSDETGYGEFPDRDERVTLLYYKAPPTGVAKTIAVTLSNSSRHKIAGVLFLSGVDLAQFSDPGAATPLKPVRLVSRGGSGTATITFDGTQAPLGSLAVSAIVNKNTTLNIVGAPEHVQQWRLDTAYLLSYSQGGGGTRAGSAAGAALSWAPNDNYGMAACVIPTGNQGPTDITGGLTVSDTAPNGTVAGTLTVSDPDGAPPYVWSLVDSAGGRFALTPSGDTLSATVTIADASQIDAGLAPSHVIRVSVEDPAAGYNKVFEKDIPVTVTDATSPVITNITSSRSAARHGASVTLSATITDNVSVAWEPQMTVNGVPLTFPVLDGDVYSWLWNVPAGAPEGPVSISVSAVDPSGNTAAAAANDLLVVDNVAPTLSYFSVSDIFVKPGDTVVIGLTVADNVAVSSSPVPALTVAGVDAGPPSVYEDWYEWTYVIPADAAEGFAVLSVTARDTAGNTVSGTAADLLSVDRTQPSVHSIQSSVPWARAGTVVSISADVSDNFGLDGLPTLRLNGNLVAVFPAVAGSVHTWTFTVGASEMQGAAAIEVAAVDRSGNARTASPSSTILTVDRTQPNIGSLTVSPAAARVGTAVTLTAQVIDNYGISGTPLMTVNGLPVPAPSQSGYLYTWVFTVPSGVSEGPAAIAIYASDLAGNARNFSNNTALTLDPNPPQVTGITASPTQARAGNAVVFSATITDLTGVSGSPSLTVNGVAAAHAGASGGVHTWNFTVPAGAPEGNATVRVTAADTLGNSAVTTSTSALLIDRTAPVISNVQAVPAVAKLGDSVRLVFAVTDALTGVFGTPSVTVNAASAAFHSQSGTVYEFRYTVRAADPEGPASVLISTRDVVGNGGIVTLTSALTIDNTVPTVSGLSVYPEHAGDGVSVLIGFRVNDSNGIPSPPSVKVNGLDAVFSTSEDGYYEYTFTVRHGEVAEGPATVSIVAVDALGNSGSSQSTGMLKVDTLPPAGAVTVNNGDVYTRVPSVTLALAPEDGVHSSGVVEMCLSDDGALWLPWEPFSPERAWTLTPGQGWKKVHVKFKDRAGNISSPALQGTIALNPNPLAVDQESPASVSTVQGASTILEVGVRNAFGSAITYAWYKDGQPLEPLLGPGKADGPVFALESIGPGDIGTYVCVVSDELETRESDPFTVSLEMAVPAAGGAALLFLAALLAAAGALRVRARGAGRAAAAALLAAGVFFAANAPAEVAVVYSARASSGSLGDDALKALARERGSVELWTPNPDGTLRRDIVRMGDPGVGNPLFMTRQSEQMDLWASKGAKTDLLKDGSSLVTVPLEKGLDMVYQRPKTLDGPTFEVRLLRDGEVVLTESWWEQQVGETLRPVYIRIDDGRRVMVQVFEYTDLPPPPLPSMNIVKEGYDALPEGMKPVALPAAPAGDKAEDTQSREVQFIVPQQGLDTLGFDSGWIPSGGMGDPGGFVIQLRVRAAAGYNYDAAVNGIVSLTPENLLGVGAARGTWGFYFGAEFSLKAAADLSWIPLIGDYLDPFTIDIPYVPDFNLVASDRDSFNNWLLDSVSHVRDDAGRTNVVKLDIIALAITQGVLPELPSWLPVKPTIMVGLDVAAIADGTLTCDSISLTDGNAFTEEAQQLPVVVPPEGYSAVASYNDTASLNLGAKIYPYFTASIKVLSWSWGYTYPSDDDPNNFLNQIEWLPIKHTDFPFSDAELNFTGQPPAGNPTDWFTQKFTLSTNDLDFKRVRFTPNMSNNYYVACLEDPVAEFRTPVAGATVIPLGRDTFARVDLEGGRTFPLYGRHYSSLYIGSNGYITFEAGDGTRDNTLENHFSQPRISGHFTGLKPDEGGTVYFQQLPNRAVVTFDKVVITKVGIALTVSFQVEMFFDGRIVITWLAVDDPYGLVGLSRGGGVPEGFENSRFSAYGGCLSGIADEGGVRVNFLPPAVLPHEPRWRLDNGAWMQSGMNASGLLGQHTVSFNYIPNLWQAPAPVQVNLSTPDAFVELEPVWTRQLGTVRVYVQPETASWILTDGDGIQHTGTGGAELTGMPTGDCVIEWQPLPTYATPDPAVQTRYLYPDSSVVFNGVYPPIIGEGRADLTMILVPEAALLQGAQWRVNGGAWLDSGVTVEIQDGDNALEFKDIAGWLSPAPQTLFFTRDTATTLTKGYVRQTGTIVIDVDPAGAPWTLVDGDGVEHSGNGDTTLTAVPTGTITVTWGAVPSYAAPAPNPVSVSLVAGQTRRITGAYVPVIGEGEGILRVTLHPEAAVAAGAMWRVIGGEWRSSGGMEPVADGPRTVKFLEMPGWATPADLVVNVIRDQINDASADYVRQTGTVQIDVTPDSAPWTMTDADGAVVSGAGDAVFESAPTGLVSVQWGLIEGYTAPAPNPLAQTLEEGQTLLFAGAYSENIVTADFSAFPLTGPLPLDVTFTDASTSTNKDILEWRWYFGDGKSSTERNPRHTYQAAGQYTVMLTVSTGEEADFVVKKQHITVTQGLPAAGGLALAALAGALTLAGARSARRRR